MFRRPCQKKPQTSPSPPTQPGPSHLSIGEALFARDWLGQVARDSGLVKRRFRKIDPLNLLGSLVGESLRGSPSYNDLAASIEANHGAGPSRQAVALRLGRPFEDFLGALLGELISRKIDGDIEAGRSTAAGFRGHKRVLVQDSTVIRLPAALFPLFSGVSNRTSTVCNARIQAVYDLIGGRLTGFSIDSYSKNDLAAAPGLEIGEGDLVLRDRGYLTAAEVRRHVDLGADLIYRHKTGMVYLDPATLLPLDLPALLRRRGSLDMEVLLNDGRGTRVRLLAAPVDAEAASLRRMRAKKEAKGHNPSAAVLELMGWTIFITSIPAATATFAEILGIYGLRWRIEVIFKAWKNHLKFDVIHRVSAHQLRILLKARLLAIAAASNLYRRFEGILWRKHRRRLSLLKFMNYLAAGIDRLRRVVCPPPEDAPEMAALLEALARYCCYDKRKKRRNFNEIWESFA